MHDWIYYCIHYWYPKLDPEVASSLEYEYTVNHRSVKAAWYSPCVRRSVSRAGARNMGEKVRWVLGWFYGRMFYWCDMVKVWS